LNGIDNPSKESEKGRKRDAEKTTRFQERLLLSHNRKMQQQGVSAEQKDTQADPAVYC
jgi:hypothetical protein